MSESSQTPTSSKTPLLSDGVYDKLKHTVAIVLPALAAAYIGLGQIWHFSNIEQVSGTIATINTLLGVVLGLSSKSYNNSDTKYAGTLVRTESPDKVTYSLELNQDTPALDKLDEVTFKVSDTGSNPIVDQSKL